MPRLWAISRICEEFACLPSQAAAEIDRLPVGVIEDILLLRSVAAIVAQFESGKKEADVVGDARLVTWVGDFIGEQQKADLAERQRRDAERDAAAALEEAARNEAKKNR